MTMTRRWAVGPRGRLGDDRGVALVMVIGVAAVLMLCGIALLGLVTASLASFLVERYQEEDEEEDQARDDARFAALHEEIRGLREELRRLVAEEDRTG